tara:strand:+ start:399 stop:1007 length:609 start_codon:yes stop_codon:yes gene_type:complete
MRKPYLGIGQPREARNSNNVYEKGLPQTLINQSGHFTPKNWNTNIYFIGTAVIFNNLPGPDFFKTAYLCDENFTHCNPLVFIEKSEGRGLGLFAKTPILKDTSIINYAGVIQPLKNDGPELYSKNMYCFQLMPFFEIDAQFCGNESRYINSANYNEVANVYSTRVIHRGLQTLQIKANQNIKLDDELLLSYGDSYPDIYCKR